MVVVVVVIVLLLGAFYFHLHALPERMAHRANRTQMEIVAVLALIALFTHQNIFWIMALLLAFIQFPVFRTPVVSIAESLQRMAARNEGLSGVPQGSLAGPGLEDQSATVPAVSQAQSAAASAGHSA
ncbi:MAG: hypothetical protein JNL61_16430 [Rhizobiaceae bacterium]|nr:hypothetical protein [Rhizobiaceae bacterium]